MMIKGVLDWETKRCLDEMEACNAYVAANKNKTTEYLMMMLNQLNNISNYQKRVNKYRKIEEFYREEIWAACVWHGLYKEEE